MSVMKIGRSSGPMVIFYDRPKQFGYDYNKYA